MFLVRTPTEGRGGRAQEAVAAPAAPAVGTWEHGLGGCESLVVYAP